MRKCLFLIVVVLLTACEKDMMEPAALGPNVGIIGTWVEDQSRGDTLQLQRSGKLDQDKYGFKLDENGTFLERKNAGWCGTAPITYDTFEGSWEVVSDSLLDITVGYWGGVMTYQIRIISVDDEELVIKYLYTDAREEAR
jgi:hypothetical protein